jgi:uncharacterized protein (UPF0332 family)
LEKTLFDYDDCLAKGLIKKTAPSKDKAKQSLLAAGKWFEEAEMNASGRALRSSLLSAYLAMFHAARAILFTTAIVRRAMRVSPGILKRIT